MNNLFPSCVDCNLGKSNLTTRTARSWNGKTRAPLTPEKRNQAKAENGVIAALGGGVLGFAVGGPVVAFICALTAGHLGSKRNPD